MDNSVGKRIEKLRKSKKISQEDLAEKVGVSRTTVYKWESGTSVPNFAKLQALACALEITVSFLAGETPFEYTEEESKGENEIALSVGSELCAADITYENPAEEAYCDKPKLRESSEDNDGKKGGRAIFLAAAAILSLIGCVIFSALSVFISIIVFSENKGAFYANTSGTSIDHFILSVIAAVLCLSASVTCFVVRSKKSKK